MNFFGEEKACSRNNTLLTYMVLKTVYLRFPKTSCQHIVPLSAWPLCAVSVRMLVSGVVCKFEYACQQLLQHHFNMPVTLNIHLYSSTYTTG